MNEQQDVTLGEVARTVARIETLVTEQNGRVRKLEQDAVRIKTLWSVGVVALGLFTDSLKHRLGL